MGSAPVGRNGLGFAELVETLYGMVLEPASVEPHLRKLADAVGGVGLGIGSGRPDGTADVLAVDVPQALRDEWRIRWAPPLREASRRKGIEGTFVSSEIEDAPEYADFIDVWASPQGFAELLLGNIFVSGTLVGFGIFRERGSREFDADQLALVDRLLPHTVRALQLRERMGSVAALRDAATAALERLRIAFVLLDDRAQVLEASGAARAIFAAGDGLDVVHGRLHAADPPARAALGRLLAAVVSQATHPGASVAVPRPSGRRPYALLATRLPRARFRLHGRAAAAVVFLSDPEDTAPLCEATLVQLHGFTPAEARVAARLAARRSVAEVAQELGVTVQTVRNHLKSLYAKTETTRQADLVGLLLSGPARLAAR